MSSESSAPKGNSVPPVSPAVTPAAALAAHAHAHADADDRAHGQLPTDKELVLKVIPMPRDCNPSGDIFGGWVMAQVDLAGAVVPARYVNGRMATVAVNQFVFKQPVRVGDILSFYAGLTRIGNTSITVQVEVFAEHFRAQGRYIKVTEASLTYVALDEAGKPRQIERPAESP